MGKVSLRKIFNRLRFGASGRGRYRFFVRNWSGISDINVLADALGSETFRSSMRPRPLSLAEFKSILVIAPHQDDELLGCGGLMLQARDEAIPVTVCFVTDGAQQNLEFRENKLTPAQVVSCREREARAVCQRLQAGYDCLAVDNISMAVSQDHVLDLQSTLNKTGADLVLLPWLFDGSAKHRVANQLAWHALQHNPGKVREVWGYQVNNTPFANGFIDISREIEEKISLLELYETQNEGLRRYEHQARGLAAWNSRFLPSKQAETTGRFAEIFFTVPVADYCDLIAEHYTGDFAATYLGNGTLADSMAKLAKNRHSQLK